MTRRDDAPGWRQRSDRLAVTPRDQRDERVGSRLTPSSERETMSKSRIEWMRIMRHHDRLPSNRTAVNAAGACPVHPPQHLHTSCRSLGSLTARAERPAPAASGIRVAAGYLWHRLSPRSFTGRCNGPRYPAPEPRRPVASLQAALHDSGTSWVARKQPWRCSRRTRDASDTQRTTPRARREPGESHAARFKDSTLSGRLRCGRESSQGAASRYAIPSRIHIRSYV